MTGIGIGLDACLPIGRLDIFLGRERNQGRKLKQSKVK